MTISHSLVGRLAFDSRWECLCVTMTSVVERQAKLSTPCEQGSVLCGMALFESSNVSTPLRWNVSVVGRTLILRGLILRGAVGNDSVEGYILPMDMDKMILAACCIC